MLASASMTPMVLSYTPQAVLAIVAGGDRASESLSRNIVAPVNFVNFAAAALPRPPGRPISPSCRPPA